MERTGAKPGLHIAPTAQHQDGKGKVMVAVPCGGNPDPQFLRQMLFLEAWDAKHHGHIINGGSYLQVEGTNVSHNRNRIVRLFLEGGWEWLWQIDDDMVPEPDTLDRLMEAADAKDRPIVGALCFARRAGANAEIISTLYRVQEINGQPTLRSEIGYPRDQLVPVTATGTGCLLVHRRVFIELAKRWQTPWPWFDYSEWGHEHSSWGPIPGTEFTYDGPGDHIGEDITFCLRAGSPHGNRAGYQGGGEVFPVYVHTGISVGHVKRFVIDEAEYMLRHPLNKGLPPSFVVIPVKGHHHFTEALLRQLDAQQGYAGIFLYDNGIDTDPYQGFMPERCEIIPAAGMHIHEMWNAGIRKARLGYAACNIAILNNDLVIGPEFVEGLARGLRAHDGLWAVSPNYDGRTFEGDILAVKGIAAGRMDGTGGLAGFAFMVKGELFDHGLPLFDEGYELWYGDNEFVWQIERLGGICGIVKDTLVDHIGGGSNTSGDGKGSRLSEEWKSAAERDRLRFEERWGVKVGQ